MKIAFFAGVWPVAHAQSGIVTYVDIMTRALRAAGHECVVVTHKLMERGGDIAVYVAERAGEGAPQTLATRVGRRVNRVLGRGAEANAASIARALERASEGGPVDIFEVEESFGYPFYLKERVSTPMAVRLHGPHFLVSQDPDSRGRRNRIRAEGKAIVSARAVSCATRAVLDDVLAFYGSAGDFNTVIPNPIPIPAEEWRLEDCDRNLILFVGRFDRIKGADIVLDAFARLAACRKELRLVLTGPDVGLTAADGATVKYDDYARAHLPDDIRARVSFLGRVDSARLASLRRQAFLYVSASRFDLFPYAVNEAAAMGCPVVATATPGPVELFTDGESISLAEIGNAKELAARIDALLEDPEGARSLGRSARQTVQTQLSPETVAARMVDFYRCVIDSR